MTQPTPQQIAGVDQLEAALNDLRTFIYGLDTPDLLAELRCTVGRMMMATAAEHALLSPEGLTMLAVTTALSRFDAGAAADEDGTPIEDWRPVEGAVAASEECLCHRDPEGGIRGRIQRIHELGHHLHDVAGYDGPIAGHE